MTQQYCDIENQCQHFCVYKQMVCPVYIRASHSNVTERDNLGELARWTTNACFFVPIGNDGKTVVEYFSLKEKIAELRIPASEQPSAHKIRRQL